MKRIAYYQFQPILADPQTNRNTVAAVLDSVEADLVVLPELAFS